MNPAGQHADPSRPFNLVPAAGLIHCQEGHAARRQPVPLYVSPLYGRDGCPSPLYVEGRGPERSLLRSAPGTAVAAALGAGQPLRCDERLEDEFASRGGLSRRRVAGQADLPHRVEQARHRAEALHRRLRRRRFAQLQHAATVEVGDDLLQERLRRLAAPCVERLRGGQRDQLAGDGLGTDQLTLVLEFELARDGGKRGIDVRDPRHRHVLGVQQGAALGVGDRILQHADGHALADAGALVDALVGAGEERDAFDGLRDEVRDIDAGRVARTVDPRLLQRDGDALVYRLGVVRHDLGADTVLQRRNDLAARRIVLRVRGEDEEHVEGEADGVALNLDIAFLHDVEEADLDLAGEVGQLVDGEYATVRTRQQAVVDGQLVRQDVTAARGLDRVDIADDVGDRDVRRGQLLDEARIAADPRDGRVIAVLLDQQAAMLGNGAKRVVVDLAAGQDRDFVVEQVHELANDAALGLAAQPEEDEVLPREQRVHDARHHGILVADDPGEERVARREAAQQVRAQLVLHGTRGVAGLLQFSQCRRLRRRHACSNSHRSGVVVHGRLVAPQPRQNPSTPRVIRGDRTTN
jgi:hypothetical protein